MELYFSNGFNAWRLDWGLDTWSRTLQGLWLCGQSCGSTSGKRMHLHMPTPLIARTQCQDTIGAPRKKSVVFFRFARSQNHLGCIKKPDVWALPQDLQGRSPRMCLFSSVPVESYKQKNLGNRKGSHSWQVCWHLS